MLIGIDLLWVRVGLCGGTEAYIRNLMDGFAEYDKENSYILFVARDNADSFRKYGENNNMHLHICQVDCASQWKRILWENRFLDKEAAAQGVELMYIPVYSMPSTYKNNIPYVCVIHDLQALHYPQYFSFIKRIFLGYTWRKACRSADRVVTISAFCERDLIKHYPWVKDKTKVIYNPIISKASGMAVGVIEEKYGIEQDKYFYCVSSMLPHKNLGTIIKVMALNKKRGKDELKLVISGVGGQEEEIRESLKENGIEEQVILTGFVSDKERDCLYENCRLFLFPSVFEGFGMPPIEAMRKGKRVVMTDKSCLEEVTGGRAVYVRNPFDVDEWAARIEEALSMDEEVVLFEEYELEKITGEYIRTFGDVKRIFRREEDIQT